MCRGRRAEYRRGMSTITDADRELKSRHRTMWASGDYPTMVETFLTPLGPTLVEAAQIGAGVSVLDVASGTGNAAIPAALNGAHVTASTSPPSCCRPARGAPTPPARSSSGSRPTPSTCRSRMRRSTS